MSEPELGVSAQPYKTIVAVSSGAGRSGVAVVRLSGPQVRFALATIAGCVPPARRATLRRLRDSEGDLIDTALILYFPGPGSFTGEDVAEFHVHGSRAVLSAVTATLTALPDVRLAEPGEFTRRAFEAGKLDLAAVEGLADLIDSETEWQRRQALRQMEGALGEAAAIWRGRLIQAMALLEAEIDFSDEGDVSGPVIAQAVALAAETHRSLVDALGSFRTGERVRDGFVVVLAGPPNAGKSSLLNALARRDVAIVSDAPGTTRDAIELRLDLRGWPVTLIDTAGLRDSEDAVEAEGVRRALALGARADLVLRLRAIDSAPNSFVPHARELAIATKADLPGRVLPGEMPVSARSGAGIEALLNAIEAEFAGLSAPEPALLTRERQRRAVAQGAEALERMIGARHREAELLAEDVRLAVRALERLTGRIDSEDVLDALFADFCIGK